MQESLQSVRPHCKPATWPMKRVVGCNNASNTYYDAYTHNITNYAKSPSSSLCTESPLLRAEPCATSADWASGCIHRKGSKLHSGTTAPWVCESRAATRIHCWKLFLAAAQDILNRFYESLGQNLWRDSFWPSKNGTTEYIGKAPTSVMALRTLQHLFGAQMPKTHNQ